MDPKPPSGPTSPITSPKHQMTAQSAINDETINSHHLSDATPSPISDSPHESIYRSLPTQSPPVQVMERPDDFDFSNKFSSSSSEWSSVSDESLFSIHITNSYTQDQAHLSEHSSQSNVGCLKVESLSKLDVHVSDLDEPQKVVRWKTEVERLVDEGVSSQGQQPELSPLKDHKSSEPKNKFCWSTCNCRSCDLPKWSCWNGCWKNMKCSNCKPKKTSSSHSKEAHAPTSDAPKKSGSKLQKMDLKNWCCCRSCSACSQCSCHCCWGDLSV
ncbi:hypothetical protein SSX86_007172 [Deinandra increscens subsp. villosa]|uniref:Uncharacterized protein n=1 Tax=Deinandra increscens subsp. villosa TaxID=3103831 RepID=A0AAP0DNY9_9ASTR